MNIKAIERLIAVAKEWRQYCVCSSSDDNTKLDTAIAKAEEAIEDFKKENT